VADVDRSAADRAAADTGAVVVAPDELVALPDLDGIVIATPSALHAAQAVKALDAGRSVFCQKPLGRSGSESADVVAAAKRAGRLLGVDLPYRHLVATERMHDIVVGGEIGSLFAADLTFHNAYGPDKAWFRDRALSGGGCVIDLGTHLIDLARWMMPGEDLRIVAAQLHAGGAPVATPFEVVEDHAVVQLVSSHSTAVTIACSWWLHAGQDAVISARFHGTAGSVELRNVGGSFYDFEAFLHRGTSTRPIAGPPDAWSGRAAVSWATRLAHGEPTPASELDDFVAVAEIVDRIYGR
jgi:predicted dehydrogenase